MAPKTFLKNITVPSPCKADWNAMIGNDQIRFCQHCSLDVHNLSLMSRHQAERLVANSKGRLCIRYLRNPAGGLATIPISQKLHHIGRRTSRLVAGVFTATISITSAVAQNAPVSRLRPLNPAGATQPFTADFGFNIEGTISDQNGAVIPGATISVSNKDLSLSLYASSNEAGEFTIDRLQPGFYSVRIEAPGFAAQETERLYVGDNDRRIDRTLQIAELKVTTDIYAPETSSTGGAVAIVSPENPFIRAAQEDDLEQLTSLVAGTDVNARDLSTQTTALEHAVRNANREMVQLLLSAGASVNARNEAGETVLMLIDTDATSDLIWDLVNAGAKVNDKDEDKNTPLMRAASVGNLEALKTMLEAGASVNDQNDNGVTALMLAAEGGSVHVVRALVLTGANIDLKDEEEESALDKALRNDHFAVVRYLKAKGAYVSPPKEEKE